jgi:hypothetical protein
MRAFPSGILALCSLAWAPFAQAYTRLPGPFDDSTASYSLVSNGSMESHSGTSLSSWADYTGGRHGWDSRASYAGSASAGLLDQSWTNTGAGVATVQSVSVSHGNWYVLSGYLYNGISGGGNVYLDLADQSYTQADGGSGDCSSTSTSGAWAWEFVHCTFWVPSGTHSVTVRLVTDGTINAGSYAWFDEVALTLSSSFSAPTSLGLDSDGDGHTIAAGDCDDADASVHPGASETCNGVDDDCDGTTDEASAVDAGTWYTDSDEDGYGDAASPETACSQPAGTVSDSSDCDDADAAAHPGATEYCDGHDDDCDGTVDESSAADASTWYADSDGDGYGDAGTTSRACTQPAGTVADSSDCDDGDAAAHPGATEYCDGHDDDCDGTVDEDDAVDASAWHPDLDGDGYGDSSSSSVACAQPAGAIADGSDCDDRDAAVHPGADEWCNGYDDDCDGTVDESSAVDASTWYADLDGDGYGDPANTSVACSQPPLSSTDNTDCDDSQASVHPGAEEVWYDGIDQDCDGNDNDRDEDGYAIDQDCDEDDPEVNPGATEIWYDGVDQDCSGGSDYDYDGDGYDSESHGGDDCDDADDAVWPGAPDEPYDGVVSDCDASDEYDADGDGHDFWGYGGDDCDDANSEVYPGAEEVWYDGIDQDCDGNDDDQDEDGHPVDEDCDDTDPGAWDDCDPVDTGDTGEPDVPDDTGEPELPDDTDQPPASELIMGGGGVRCGGGGVLGCWLALLGGLLAGLRRRGSR